MLLAAIWGSSFLLLRLAVPELGALPTAFARVAVATLFLLPLLVLRGGVHEMLRRWQQMLVVGLLNSGIPFMLYAFAVQHISTGLSSILNATTPLFGALVAWFWLGERLSGSRLLGLAIGFSGVTALALGKASFAPGDSGSGWAVLACLAATFCYGLAGSYTKRHLMGCPPLVSATGSQVAAAVCLLPLALFDLPAHRPSTTAWAAILGVGVLCTGVAYILFFRVIERAGPTRAITITYVVPVFAIAYGMVFLNEPLTTRMVVCGVVIAVGTALAVGLVRFGRDKPAAP